TIAAPQRRARGGVALLLAVAIAANALGQGFSRFTYSLLLPDMRNDVVHSYSLAGLLGTINLVAYLAGVLLVSSLAGRVSVVRIVGTGLALCAAGSVVLGIAPDYAVLALGMVLLGGGAAATASAARVASPLALLRSVPGSGRLTAAYVSVALGYMIYASFIAALLAKEAHFGAGHVSAVFSLIGVGGVAGSVATGRIADRVG